MIRRVAFCLLFFISCNNYRSNNNRSNAKGVIVIASSGKVDSTVIIQKAAMPDSNISGDLVLRDTVVRISIEGISLEGSEAVVSYSHGIIKKSVWTIYGETGKRIVKYLFEQNGKIAVEELVYRYKKALQDVRDENDRVLESAIKYSIDTSGVLVTPVALEDWVNPFEDFKESVPFNCLYSKLRQAD